MTALMFRVFFWLCIILTPIVVAQGKGSHISSLNFKDGLYLSLEEFKANSPSIPIDKNELGGISNGNVIRMKRFEYGPGEEDKSISSSKVLFVCIDGTVFINHRSLKKKNNRYPVSNFYRIQRVGYFCNYFLQTYDKSFYKNAKKVEAFTHLFVPGMNINVYEVSTGPQVPEYVLFLGDGQIYRVKGSAKILKGLIKRDAHFAGTRINNKELVIYMGLYNKRNLFNFGE